MEFISGVVKKTIATATKNWMAILVVAILGATVWWWVSRRSSEGFATTSDGASVFTLYYADWCPHCKEVKPAFAAWMGNGVKTIKNKPVFIKMIEEKNIDKASSPSIDGFPTFILQRADGSMVPYTGERNEAGWQAFIEANAV